MDNLNLTPQLLPISDIFREFIQPLHLKLNNCVNEGFVMLVPQSTTFVWTSKAQQLFDRLPTDCVQTFIFPRGKIPCW